jgi:hypothetical protein
LLTGIIGLAFTIPVKSLSRTPAPYTFPNLNFDVVDYVERTTIEDDCIVTDDQRFAFASNRLVPAALSETGHGRLATGWLTVEDIVNEIQRYDCPVVVYMVGYFDHYLPHLRTELRNLYFLEITYDKNFVIYTAKRHTTRKPMISSKARIGQNIVLNGIDFTPLPWRPEQEVRLATYWTVLEPPDRAYKIFVQLRNSRSETVSSFDFFPFAVPSDRYQLWPQFDYQYWIVPNFANQITSAEDAALYPTRGLVPTNAWPVDNTVREITTIKLPDLTPGTYDLYLGMYDPDSLVRLPVYNQSEGGDILWLTQIEVVENK